jgi:hypothetical protein
MIQIFTEKFFSLARLAFSILLIHRWRATVHPEHDAESHGLFVPPVDFFI